MYHLKEINFMSFIKTVMGITVLLAIGTVIASTT